MRVKDESKKVTSLFIYIKYDPSVRIGWICCNNKRSLKS